MQTKLNEDADGLDLISAWRAQPFESSPYRFVKDKENLFEGKSKELTYQQLLEDKNYATIPPKTLHLGLRPVPFIGDLADADIFVALINPGYAVCIDHFVETQPEFVETLQRNQRQDLKGAEFPFFFLDPRWHWTSGGQWWHRLMGEIIRKYATKTGITYVAATHALSRRLAALELVPYHSGNSSYIRGLASRLTSSRLMRQYVEERVIPKAEADKALLVITTGRSMWNLTSAHRNVIFPSKHARRAILSSKRGAGRRILERMLARR